MNSANRRLFLRISLLSFGIMPLFGIIFVFSKEGVFSFCRNLWSLIHLQKVGLLSFKFSQKEIGFDIKQSPGKGLGVFCREDFGKGQIIAKVKAFFWSDEPSVTVFTDVGERKVTREEHAVCLTDSLCVFGQWFVFINHSCSPNVYFEKDIDSEQRVSMLAMKPIKNGEELFLDYDTLDIKAEPMICHCGQDNCRRVIRGFKFLSQMDQERLRPYAVFPMFLVPLY